MAPKWHEAEVVEIVQETPQDRTFAIAVEGAPPGGFAYEPGQFVILVDPESDDPMRRAYSMSAAPGRSPHIVLTVRDMGRFGTLFYRFPVGKRLQLQPPQGRFTLEVEPEEDMLLVSGGSGITPFRAFVQYLADHGRRRPVWLFQSSRHAADLIFRAEFEACAEAHPWLQYIPTLTRATPEEHWPGRRGRIDVDLLAQALEDPEHTWFYACGPGSFVRSMLDAAETLAIPKARRKREQWG